MAGAVESTLVNEDTSETEAIAAGAVGLAAILFALSLAALFDFVAITDPIAGVPVVVLLGGLLVVLGGAVITFGVGSRLGYVATQPRPSAGVIASAAFALLWFVVGGFVASQTLGLGTVGWFAVALVTGGVAFAGTALPREDLGSTIPAGALALLAGLVFLGGVIDPSWVWSLGWEQQASFKAEFAIPAVTAFCSLLAGWASAKAYGGFGARGRHVGAYVLVYMNALSIITVLFLLVAFTVLKGLPGLFKGLTLGLGAGPETTLFGVTFNLPVSWPFVMNGVALLNDVNGVLPAIVGTIWLVVGAVLFAVPLGVGAAVFITEYAERGRFTQVVEVATNGLWSTPSIVFGLFGLAFLVPRLGNGKSLLAGMLTLGFMLLPLVVITSREAMLAVPDEYRDASAALGVSKWQTVRSIVLPAALPGIVTGIILGVGRIAGETAPILLTMSGSVAPPGSQTVDVIGGFEFTASPPFVDNPELLKATSALPYQLYSLITAGVGQSSNIGNIEQFRWATALILLVVVLSFYAVGIATRYYFRRKLQHE
ncbi:phosphate ABC transporter permease PstA (plasmid) [Haloferax mediterranei ATCC 33500]|uniref:Phosphate transport system permease protein PstA n=1 Tax=Haloferax mediterranei (strain ATCC 33500 / DSM 1411 / JCM 8866 / NBRC 14739 / NCIMB 2177 / R-4) TaxID=523841 RepID=I3RBB4_HALMT|nr:phosphate ABC transporter permease PstA [Haloferax mediterranei]AFK21524.1 ABC-type phosphate transport system, permease protein I [Haloferax mediterranei ATCC 33500]AHZ24422.1 phosphate ABC transporter permease [Haloferax mediterranei ATCC 33500]ELZ97163.1 phosphate ABC transporter permease [Haloferax mediterranei ATCC 33500]MDX5990093.1 phosphate ABC transporter permease PstA [Haloferax mediterranei ATCC 33500]QCQ76822.1 phosphate ABC transporter permease PstA [Haloferax mediterranei ATCC